jgi:hypothetical protein
MIRRTIQFRSRDRHRWIERHLAESVNRQGRPVTASTMSKESQ